MRKTFIVLLVLMTAWIVCALVPAERNPDMVVFRAPHFRIGHRCGQPPEATLDSCGRSVEQGLADFIEMDVHLTKDQRLAVIHDSTVDRTTNGSGTVSGLTMDEISKLDAGYRYTPDEGRTFPFRGRGIAIHPLDDFFAKFPNQRFYVEFKTEDLRAVPVMVDLIRKYGMQDKIVVASVYGPPLAKMAEIAPDVARAASFRDSVVWVVANKFGVGGLFPIYAHALALPPLGGHWIISRRMIETAKKQNIKIHIWTVNTPADMTAWQEAGVDGVMTDKIALLNEVLKQTGPEHRHD